MGKLLVGFGHGQQRHGQLGVGCCSTMAEGREGFPRLRGDVQDLEQSQGPLNRSSNAPLTHDTQTQGKRQGPTGQDQPADPVRVGAKQLVQPGRLGGLIKTQPPAGPGQIKAPPLPLQPTPPTPPRFRPSTASRDATEPPPTRSRSRRGHRSAESRDKGCHQAVAPTGRPGTH